MQACAEVQATREEYTYEIGNQSAAAMCTRSCTSIGTYHSRHPVSYQDWIGLCRLDWDSAAGRGYSIGNECGKHTIVGTGYM